MNVIESISLGLTQGLTEFIPISSSGHLVILQHFFNGASDHLFIEYINIGTVAALLVYFRHKISQIIRDVVVNKNSRLALNILITAIPAGVVGYVMAGFIGDAPFFGSLVTVAVTLAVVGVVMVVLERLPKASAVQNGASLSKKRAFTIGAVQILALIPGVSRSGSTIIAGRLSGLNPKEAAEYSFLASLPIMLGVTLMLFFGSDHREYFVENASMLILSNTIAFAAGLLAVGLLMRYLSNHSLAVFGWYRIALATVLAMIILIQ